MDIMQKVRKIKEAKGWTQQELASQLGVSQATVNRWLNNGIKRLTADNQDIVNRLHDEIFGLPNICGESPLPSLLTLRLTRLPERKKVKVFDILESALQLAEVQSD
jgi:transcriptional regulator with XRE-family HTH domain